MKITVQHTKVRGKAAWVVYRATPEGRRKRQYFGTRAEAAKEARQIPRGRYSSAGTTRQMLLGRGQLR